MKSLLEAVDEITAIRNLAVAIRLMADGMQSREYRNAFAGVAEAMEDRLETLATTLQDSRVDALAEISQDHLAQTEASQ